jgi:DNA-binding transcriptional LysR family regulator
MNLDIDALRTFVAVAEHRNFTRAAEVVARTQSTVSVQIKNLEDRLGFTLFERTKRSVALTPRGEQLLGYAHNILKLHDEGVRMVMQAPLQGRLRLGITEYFAPQHLPAMLQAFRDAHPTLEVEVTTGVTGHLRALQKSGELDLVIGRRDWSNSDGELIRREPVQWVAAEHLRLPAQATVNLALLPVGCSIRSAALAMLDKQNRPWRTVYCGPSVLGLQSAVAAGMAVSCLTQSAVLPGFRILGAREGLPQLPHSEIALFMRSKPNALLRQLAAVVHGYFSQPGATLGSSASGSTFKN